MSLATGTILNNRYRIVKLLNQGGFGAVYRAWDLNLKRACAVKENLGADPQAQLQFEREALILSNLNHPNLARVTDYFFIPGQGQYLVMDFVEGEDLQEMLERAGKPLAEGQVLPWISQVCDALAYLHGQNPPIIHRDIKPANIKITSQGKAMLVDFGIAKVYESGKKTTIGARAVTPGFSPHEQYGQGTTDARSDIYALGATLYTLLTGQEPVESVQRFPVDSLVSPGKLNPRLSQAAVAATIKALHLHPDQRHQTAADLKYALSGRPATFVQPGQPAVVAATQPASMRQPQPQSLSEVPPPFNDRPFIAVVLVAFLLIIGFVIITNFPEVVHSILPGFPFPSPIPPIRTPIPVIAPTKTPLPVTLPFWDGFNGGIKPEWNVVGDPVRSSGGNLVVDGATDLFIGDNTWKNYKVTLKKWIDSEHFGYIGIRTVGKLVPCILKKIDSTTDLGWYCYGGRRLMPNIKYVVQATEVVEIITLSVVNKEITITFAYDSVTGPETVELPVFIHGGIVIHLEQGESIDYVAIDPLP